MTTAHCVTCDRPVFLEQNRDHSLALCPLGKNEKGDSRITCTYDGCFTIDSQVDSRWYCWFVEYVLMKGTLFFTLHVNESFVDDVYLYIDEEEECCARYTRYYYTLREAVGGREIYDYNNAEQVDDFHQRRDAYTRFQAELRAFLVGRLKSAPSHIIEGVTVWDEMIEGQHRLNEKIRRDTLVSFREQVEMLADETLLTHGEKTEILREMLGIGDAEPKEEKRAGELDVTAAVVDINKALESIENIEELPLGDLFPHVNQAVMCLRGALGKLEGDA